MSSSEASRAHVSLPPEMRPLLDRAQETLEAPSWASTVQTLLEHFLDGDDRAAPKETLDRAKREAVDQALERVAKALHFVLEAAELEVDRATVDGAVSAAAADADPLAFSRFALEVRASIDRMQARSDASEQLGALKARLDTLQDVLAERQPPRVVVKSADADADADS